MYSNDAIETEHTRSNHSTEAVQGQQPPESLAGQPGIHLQGLPENITSDALLSVFSDYFSVAAVQVLEELKYGEKAAVVNLLDEAAVDKVGPLLKSSTSFIPSHLQLTPNQRISKRALLYHIHLACQAMIDASTTPLSAWLPSNLAVEMISCVCAQQHAQQNT